MTADIHSSNLGFLMSRLVRLHHQHMQSALSELGLHRGQPPVMWVLWKTDGISQKELTQALGVSPPTLSVMIGRLEKAGFVERRRDPTNNRISRIYLTDHGRSLQTQVDDAIQRVEFEMAKGLSEDDQDTMRRCISLMEENVVAILGITPNQPHHRQRRKPGCCD